MQLKILGSSSAGNCYILENEREALIIECGVHIKQIKKALNFNVSKVAAALISHDHADHCKSAKDVLKAGIPIYASFGTLQCLNLHKHYSANIMFEGEMCRIGNFSVLPFKARHDAVEPFGFLIYHEETGNTLFLTDSFYTPHKFRDLNNIIVEANYSEKILDSNMRSGETNRFVRNRVLASHMSIETCEDLLRANDLTAVNNIVLIHLSNSNSDAIAFKKKIEGTTGKCVHVAESGMVISLNKTPF